MTCQPLVELVAALAGDRGPLVPVDGTLHRSPSRLRGHLQQIIDGAGASRLVLAMGLCGGATSDLAAGRATLALPLVDDCLALLLGSQEEYRRQTGECPGTYFLSKGWLDSPDSIVGEYERCRALRGADFARRMVRCLIGGYRRMVYIETGLPGEEEAVSRAGAFASAFGLEFLRRPGDLALLSNLVRGRPDPRVLTLPPGATTSFFDFLPRDNGHRPAGVRG